MILHAKAHSTFYIAAGFDVINMVVSRRPNREVVAAAVSQNESGAWEYSVLFADESECSGEVIAAYCSPN